MSSKCGEMMKNEIYENIKKNIIRLVEQSRLDEAMSLLDQYVELCPHDIESYSIYANIFVGRKNYDEAEEAIISGLSYDFNNMELLFNLATILELKSEKRQAKKIYELVSKKTDNVEICQFSSNALLRLEETNSAKQDIKIFQGTIEIANQMNTLVEGLKKKGFAVEGANYYANYLQYNDAFVPEFLRTGYNKDSFEKEAKRFCIRKIFHNDIFHFHFGTSLTTDNLDLVYLKELKKKTIMHYWGSEIRQKSIAGKKNPYVVVKDENEKQIIENIKRISSCVEHCIVADLELKQYVQNYYPNIHFLRTAIDLNNYSFVGVANSTKKKMKIVHAPTHAEAKGTRFIIGAVERLKSEFDFDFELIQGMKHEEAKRIYRESDLIVDQLCFGTYGVLAIESMALGKPVICYLNEEYLESYSANELPIINANPDTIYDVLKQCLKNREGLVEIGLQGRRYIEKYHAVETVTKELVKIYHQL